MSIPYTPTEIAFIKEQYPTIGATWCGRRLNRPAEVIRRKAKEMGLQGPATRYKPDETRNMNPVHLHDIKLSEVAYFLGFFWADGHIHRYRNKSRNLTYHRVAIEVAKEDGEHLRRIAETFGRWAVVERQRKRYGVTCKPVLGLIINNEPVYRFLFDHGYDSKSVDSPDLILAKVPPHLQPAFWLGYFDGDGSISSVRPPSRRLRTFNVQLCGSYEQDWAAMESMLRDLGIKYALRREMRPNGQSRSIIVIQNQRGIHAFYDYIKPFERLGLPRKQDRFRQFVLDHPKPSEARVDEGANLGKALVT